MSWNNWKSSRVNKILLSLILILAAVFLVLTDVGLIPDVGTHLSVWEILVGALFGFFALRGLVLQRPLRTMTSLTILFFVFQDELAYLLGRQDGKLLSAWVVLLAAALITVGWGGLLGAKKRKWRAKLDEKLNLHIGNTNGKGHALGSTSVYVDAKNLGVYWVENVLGEYDLFVENPEAYTGDGTIEIDNKLGEVTLHIPRDWNVRIEVDNKLGEVNVTKGNGNGPLLTITGSNSLGEITIARF